jgi:hypothetical protein
MFYIFVIVNKNIDQMSNQDCQKSTQIMTGFNQLLVQLVIGAVIYLWIQTSDFTIQLGSISVSTLPNKFDKAIPSNSYIEFDEEQVNQFIKEFWYLAELHEKQFGIPASLNMASAILESNAGTRDEAARQGLHFLLGTNHKQKSVKKNWQKHSEYIHKSFKETGLNPNLQVDWQTFFNYVYSNGDSEMNNQIIWGIVQLYGLNNKNKYLALN